MSAGRGSGAATARKTGKRPKPDATAEFFARLAERGGEPLFKSASGTLRFDLADGKRIEHWHVALTNGDVAVSNKNTRADAVVRVDKELFQGMVAGRVNAMAATLRGVLVPEGDLGLVVLFQRLFPGPPRPRAGRPRAGAKRRKR